MNAQPVITGAVFCTEQAAEPWLQAIVRRVYATLTQYLPEITEQEVESIVRLTCDEVANRLREGTAVTLLQIGTLVPAEFQGERVVMFEPADYIARPLPFGPNHVNPLKNRRRNPGGYRA